MQQGQQTERMRLLREKIAQLSKIDPNLRISKEELQERKRKFWNVDRKSLLPPRSENQTVPNAAPQQQNGPKPPTIIKKVFTFDSGYYRDLHQQYERTALASIIPGRNEPQPPVLESKKEPEEGKQERKEEAPKIASNVNQPTSLIKLLPVDNQEPAPSGEQLQEEKKFEPAEPPKAAQAAQQPPQFNIFSPPPVELTKVDKQNSKESKLTGEEKQNAEEKIPQNKIPTEPPKVNFFGNPSTSSLFGKNEGSMGNLFSINQNKNQEAEPKPFGLFSGQKAQPTFASCGKDASTPSEQKNDVQKPSIFQAKPPIFNFPSKIEPKSQSQKLEPSEKTQASKVCYSQEITSIFDTNNKGGLNLNASKSSIPMTMNFFTNKNSDEKTEQKKQVPPLSLFGKSPTIPLNIQTPNTVPNVKNDTVEMPKPLFSDKNQNKPAFGGLFSTSSKPDVSVPFFGQVNQSSPLFAAEIPKQKTVVAEPKPIFAPIFPPPINPQPEIQAAPAQDDTKNESLFQKKPLFGIAVPKPSLFGTPQGGLSSKPIQNSTVSSDEAPSSNKPNLFTSKEPQKIASAEEITHKQSDNSQKKQKIAPMFTAIGPGGKKIQMQPLFQVDNKKPNPPNLFTSGATETKNFFTQPTTTSNLFQTPINNIFQANPDKPGLFSQQANQSKSLFGAGDNSLFGKQAKAEEDEGEDEQDDGPLEAEDDANPSLSTGKYDYIQTQIFFKENANKFREGSKETMDNIVISIQKFENSEDRFLYVRMPNKCIAFCGKFLKNITESRIINSNLRNVEVKKILRTMENVTQAELSIVKIQFKDELTGEKFMKEVEQAIGKQ